MKGIDISHWQGDIDWKKVAKDKQKIKFAFIKATESTGFLDDKLDKNRKMAREAGLLCGFYHFARGGDYKKEADWFLKNVGDLKDGELLALDYEIYDLADPADWCRKWLDYVESRVGFKPLLYTYHAHLLKYDWKKVSDDNFGLWAARYGQYENEPNEKYAPAIGSWNFFAIWQFTSKGRVDGISGDVDLNWTGMDLETLKSYGSKEVSEVADNKYVENLYRIYFAVEDLFDRKDGDNPNDEETAEIVKDLSKLTDEIDELRKRPKEKIVEKIVEKPVEKIVYRDKVVEVPAKCEKVDQKPQEPEIGKTFFQWLVDWIFGKK